MNETDQELLNQLRTAATDCRYSPEAFLAMAIDAAKWQAKAAIPNCGPYPTEIDEAEIDSEILAVWPEWVSRLVPAGSKWERLHWPDGSVTIRLVNHRGLVLAANQFEKRDTTQP
jgi:hypothetical protein